MTTDDTGSSGTGGTVDSKGLKGGSLGLLSSVVVGMASTAPAYSLAAVLGLHRRQRRGRQGRVHRAAGLRPDLPDRRRLPGAEQGRTRLRHHLHLGVPRVRTADRLDGRLGHHRRRRHRDGQPGADRGRLLVHLRRRPRLDVGGRPRQQHAVVDGGRRHLDRRDDLHLLPRHRGVGPPAVLPARLRGDRPRRHLDLRADQGLHRATHCPSRSIRRCPGSGRAVWTSAPSSPRRS